ncbi:MAG: sugar phosphate isomerase/epimerase family protein [Christensenella sp.]|uniref:sugar phosphate isomerase/epimerase family protein n=1 Tax=Christensenella sp. TaxID=1935934 RepID=UPI002B1FF3CF|nr:sugar phosphate isomerase/epimerase family protein [Christensenella sp.]MEA5003293.1 sugar phosphate isomerase/epimerase family protein [Christensenella sp.]
MGYRYACADFTFPLLEHQNVLELIRLLGFDGVDIGLFQDRSHLQPSDELKDPSTSGEKLKQSVQDAGIAVADVFLQSDLDFSVRAINHPDDLVRKEEREQFSKFLDYALAAHSGHITCLPGVHFAQEAYEQSYARATEELLWRVGEARRAGIAFGIEAHIGGIVDTPEKTARLIADVDGLTLTLDYTHFVRMGITDEQIQPLMPYASHFHARGAAKGKLQTVRAENTIDYDAVMREMKKTGYQGFVGIEYTWTEWEDCNRTDNVSESILLMRQLKEAER